LNKLDEQKMKRAKNNYGLNNDKLLLLYFYAYMADDGIEKSLAAFCREFAYNQTQVIAWTWELRRAGLTKDYYMGWRSSAEINYNRFLPIAAQMLEHEKELLGVFDHMHLKRNATTLSFWRLAEYYYSGDSLSILKLFKSDALEEVDWEELLKGKLQDPVLHDVFLAVTPESFAFLLDNALAVDIMNQTTGCFADYENLVLSRTGDRDRDAMVDKLRALDYFASGKPFVPSGNTPTEYALAVDAVKALYERNLALAEERFAKALKIRNKEAKVKNVFDDIVLNFFLAVGWKLSDTPDSRKKMDQFLRKETSSLPEGIAARVVINYVNTDNDRKYLPQALADIYTVGRNSIVSYRLANLLAAFFGVRWREKEADVNSRIPEWAILRHEMSPYVEIPNKEVLEFTYGGKPLLSSVKGKATWEITIDEMMAKFTRPSSFQSGAEAPREVRIGYFVRYKDVDIHQQKRLKTGGWGAGASVSLSRFRSGDVEGMDEMDRHIAKHLDNGYYSRASLEDVLPYLVGTDRVYVGRYAPYQQAVVDEEKPFLNVGHTKKGFTFSSNISEGNRKGGHIIKSDAPEHFIVIKYSPTQYEIASMLCAKGMFPEESADALARLLTQLSSVLEIHSDLLDGGSSLEDAAPDSRLIARVTPQRGSFDLKVMVRPLRGGTKSFFPGEGDRIIYDTSGGKRYQVKRDVKQETQALHNLDAVLEDVREGTMTIGLEQMLDLLDFAAGREELVLEWPEGESLKLKGSVGAVSIEVTSGERWFDMEGDVTVGEESIAIARILDILSHSRMAGRYLPLGDGQYVKLSESLKKSLQKLESLAAVSRGKSRVSVFQAGALSDLLSSGFSITTDKAFRETVAKIERAAASVPQVPKGLKAELRDYQAEGFRFMSRLTSWGGGACLADDMGLGKTVQALALILSRAKEGPSIVVAPASVVLNWKSEMERFTPGLRPHVLGPAAAGDKKLSALKSGDVLLASYGMLVSRQEVLSAVKWNVACLDEAHTIKNRGTKMSAAAMSLQADARVILTGTPVQNHLGELWNLMQFLLPGMLGSYEQFSQRYITPIEKNGDRARQAALKKLIQPFLLRRTKADVLDELPEKTDIVRMINLTGEEMASYEMLRQSAQEALEEQDSMDVNALAMITKLRMAACGSSKAAYFADMAEEIVAAGNRALVFSQFTSYLKTVSQALDVAGIPYLYLDGSTPVRKRNALVKEFQEGEVPLFLISLKAGGLGLNLTGANYVVHLDPWWNPAIEQQATDRAYRIGQTKDVTVYHLISANTIEEKILRLHKVKRNLADSLLEGTHMASALTLEDLRALAESAMD